MVTYFLFLLALIITILTIRFLKRKKKSQDIEKIMIINKDGIYF